jgi:hypothetical protein
MVLGLIVFREFKMLHHKQRHVKSIFGRLHNGGECERILLSSRLTTSGVQLVVTICSRNGVVPFFIFLKRYGF